MFLYFCLWRVMRRKMSLGDNVLIDSLAEKTENLTGFILSSFDTSFPITFLTLVNIFDSFESSRFRSCDTLSGGIIHIVSQRKRQNTQWVFWRSPTLLITCCSTPPLLMNGIQLPSPWWLRVGKSIWKIDHGMILFSTSFHHLPLTIWVHSKWESGNSFTRLSWEHGGSPLDLRDIHDFNEMEIIENKSLEKPVIILLLLLWNSKDPFLSQRNTDQVTSKFTNFPCFFSGWYISPILSSQINFLFILFLHNFHFSNLLEWHSCCILPSISGVCSSNKIEIDIEKIIWLCVDEENFHNNHLSVSLLSIN